MKKLFLFALCLCWASEAFAACNNTNLGNGVTCIELVACSTTSASSCTATVASTSAKDTLLVAITEASNPASSLTSVVNNAPGGSDTFSAAISSVAWVTTWSSWTYYASNIKAGSTSVTVTLNQAPQGGGFLEVQVFHLSGLASSPLDIQTSNVNTSGSNTAVTVGPSSATAQANEYALCLVSHASAGWPIGSPGGGFTLEYSDGANTGAEDLDKNLSAIGTVTCSGTLAAGGIWNAQLTTWKFGPPPVESSSSGSGDRTVTATSTVANSTPIASRMWTLGPQTPYLPTSLPPSTFPGLAPAGYTVTAVTAGTLQTAINAASCSPNGTVLLLSQGAVDNETITLPTKSCAAGKYIIVATSGLNYTRGTRLDPSSATNGIGVMAQITASTINTPIFNDAGNTATNSYWFYGLDIQETGTVSEVILLGNPTDTLAHLPHDICFDHTYIHGRAANQPAAGYAMVGNNLCVIDSYISDIHQLGQDSQALAGYSGGPWLIQNNFLQGAGEDTIWCGGGVGAIDRTLGVLPHDLTETGNFYYNPPGWLVGNAQYVGFPWVIKNIHESKCAQRELVQNSYLENMWTSGQDGYAVLVTPTTQGSSMNVIQDLTFQNNIIKHVNNGFQFTGQDATAASDVNAYTQIHRVDRLWMGGNLLDDTAVSASQPTFADINRGPQNIVFDHNTQTTDTASMNTSITVNNDSPTVGFYLTNNIVAQGTFGVFVNSLAANDPGDMNQYLGCGADLPAGCGKAGPTINNFVYEGPAISGGCAAWFTNTQCPATMAAVKFVNWNSGVGGDYRLCTGAGTPAGGCASGSPYAANGVNPCTQFPTNGAAADCGANDANLAVAKAAKQFPANWPNPDAGGGISLSPASLVCNNSNTTAITPVGGINFTTLEMDVLVNAVIVTPGAASPTSITITPPTHAAGTVPVTVSNFGLPFTATLTCQ